MWNKRIWDSTRGRIVSLLRQRQRTVEELAAELGVTDNAIRAQLGALERDGLVRAAGSRKPPAAGKPAILYDVPLEADPAVLARAGRSPLLAGRTCTLAAAEDGGVELRREWPGGRAKDLAGRTVRRLRSILRRH